MVAQKGMWKDTCRSLNFSDGTWRTHEDYCADPSAETEAREQRKTHLGRVQTLSLPL